MQRVPRVVITFLAILLVGSSALSPQAKAQEDDLQQQLEQVRQQKDFYSQQQGGLTSALDSSSESLKVVKASIEKQRAVLDDATKKVDAINRQLTVLKEQRGKAMRQSYITGTSVSYLYALLDSGSLSEFLSKGTYTNLLVQRKDRAVESVDEQISRLEGARDVLVTKKMSIESEVAMLEKKLRDLQQQLAENQAKLAEASALEAALMAKIGDFTAGGCRTVGKDEASDDFTLAGSGTEHGLGMSQYGAKGAAAHGKDYKGILSHYYKGTSIQNVGSFGTNQGESEAYLVGVVDAEMPTGPGWGMEALKAQAIVARSYAYINRNRLDNSQNTQAWVPSNDPRAKEAVDSTRGQVLTYGGDVIPAFFHSTSGGCTENNENVWGGAPLPWLRGVSSPWEEDSPSWNWRSHTYSKAQMQGILNQDGRTSVGELKSVKILGRGVSGRVTSVEISGSSGTKRVSGPTFKSIFNAYSPNDEPGLRSTLYGFV
jgi:SpoIID/LytB domain protein